MTSFVSRALRGAFAAAALSALAACSAMREPVAPASVHALGVAPMCGDEVSREFYDRGNLGNSSFTKSSFDGWDLRAPMVEPLRAKLPHARVDMLEVDKRDMLKALIAVSPRTSQTFERAFKADISPYDHLLVIYPMLSIGQHDRLEGIGVYTSTSNPILGLRDSVVQPGQAHAYCRAFLYDTAKKHVVAMPVLAEKETLAADYPSQRTWDEMSEAERERFREPLTRLTRTLGARLADELFGGVPK